MKRPKKYRHLVHEEVAADIQALGEEPLKLLALKTIRKILTGEIVGRELDNRRSTGDLSDCRKVLFDVRTDIAPRFRIVYREIRSELEIVAIETLSVGERYALEAYLNAALRLGRTDPGIARNK
jgi:hypothetical protein